jgi:beta-galactosidase
LKQNGRDKLDFYIDTGAREVLTVDLPSDWQDVWHNVTAVYDGATMAVYIDGQLAGERSAKGNIRNLPLSLCIGRDEQRCGQETNEYICDAVIDNVGIFDKAVIPSDGFNVEESVLWLDFESESNEGTFWSYGVGARTYGSIWPDRTPQPEMWQMKKSVQPLSFRLLDPDNGIVEVWNRNHFINADYYRTVWAVTADNNVVASGELPLDVKPLSRSIVKIPYLKPSIVPGKEYRLDISSVLKEDEIWAEAGYEVSWEQFELKDWNLPAEKVNRSSSGVSIEESDRRIRLSGNGFSYSFDSSTGELVSILSDGKEVLSSPLRLNVWRAPLANELDGWNAYSAGASRSSGYGSIGHSNTLAAHYYSAGLDNLGQAVASVSTRAFEGGAAVDVRELILLGGGRGETRQLDQYISGMSFDGFESIWSYIVYGDGRVNIRHTVKPHGTMPPYLPRIGITFVLDGSLSNVQWYGRGPQANYPDRKSGYRIGIWNTTVEDMYEPYLIPQEYGLRTDNRWVRMTDSDGKGVEFSVDQLFNFNAYPYATDNLTKAVYQYQLQKTEDITFNLDYATSGVGCTARGIFNAYRVYPQCYERTITIRLIR